MRDLPRNGERVIGIEPTTLCLASTRSSQLSYTRKSEEVLVLPRLCGVKLERQDRRASTLRQRDSRPPVLYHPIRRHKGNRCAASGVMQ